MGWQGPWSRLGRGKPPPSLSPIWMETRPKQPATVWINEILTGPTALVLVWVLESRVARPQGGDWVQHLPWIQGNRDSPTCGKWIKPLIKGPWPCWWFLDFYVEARNYSPVWGAVTLIMKFYVRVLQHLWESLATNCVQKLVRPRTKDKFLFYFINGNSRLFQSTKGVSNIFMKVTGQYGLHLLETGGTKVKVS